MSSNVHSRRAVTNEPLSNGRVSSVKRREQLVAVATRLFSQHGFNGVTTKEIAHAAGVNQAILFRHFVSKDELYAAILERKARSLGTADLLRRLRELATARDDETLFKTLIVWILESNRRDPDFTRLMLFSALEGHELAKSFRNNNVRPVFKVLRDYVTLRQREGIFRQCDPRIVVRGLFAMPSYHAQVQMLFDCRLAPLSDTALTAHLTHLILGGLYENAPLESKLQSVVKPTGVKKVIKRRKKFMNVEWKKTGGKQR